MPRKPIIIIITLLATVIFVFLVVLPKKEALDNSKKAIQKKEQEVKARENYSKEIEDISKNLENYQNQIAKIKLAVPDGPQVLDFYNFLQKSTSRAGLVLQSINYGLQDSESPGTQGLKNISLSLGVSGTMDGFKNFISILEKSARMIDIESFSFTGPDKEKDVINFNIQIKTRFIN